MFETLDETSETSPLQMILGTVWRILEFRKELKKLKQEEKQSNKQAVIRANEMED